MNDSNKSSNGLLVLKLSKPATANVIDELTEVIAPIADKLGVEPMVLPPGVDVELKMGSEALLLRVCEALEKIAMSDQAPVLETQEGPSERPTLNARPGTLNSRPDVGLMHGTDFPEISEEGTWLLQRGEKVSSCNCGSTPGRVGTCKVCNPGRNRD